MSEHSWFTLPPDNTTTDATRYEVCDCGAKRQIVFRCEGSTALDSIEVWVYGPYEHPKKE